MSTRIYTHQRTNKDRRADQDRRAHDRRVPQEDTGHDQLFGLILDKLDDIDHPNHDSSEAHKGEKLTFTLPQILGTILIIITVFISVATAWVNLNNQMTSQKVSTDLTIAQLQKDVTAQAGVNKELQAKMDNIVLQIQGSIDKLSSRVEELDNTVSQLYNRILPQKK